jgi:hypothetical protein
MSSIIKKNCVRVFGGSCENGAIIAVNGESCSLVPYDVTAGCVIIGSNGTDLKIAIVAAAPAKVEMEEVVGIIAVA